MKTKKFLNLPFMEKEAMKNIKGGCYPSPIPPYPDPRPLPPFPIPIPWPDPRPFPLYGIEQPGRG